MIAPRIKLNKYGKRAFSCIGPVTWNSVPKPLNDDPSRSFKSNLETFVLKKKKKKKKKSICTENINSQSNPPGCWAKLVFFSVSSVSAERVCTSDC